MRLFTLACITFVLPALALAAEIPKGGSLLLSKNADGQVANANSERVSISSNGKRIGVTTVASNLGSGTFNGFSQVFMYQRGGELLGVSSLSTLDAPANLDCVDSKLSANGRFVAFESASTLFVPGVIGGTNQVFHRDTKTGDVVLASVTTAGTQVDVGATLLDMSRDGRFILFGSGSANVVPAAMNPIFRAYVRDLKLGTTVLASRNDDELPLSNATYNAQISGDGRYVFFASASPEIESINKIGTYVRDLKKGRTKILSRNFLGEVANAYTMFLGMSENGRFVVMQTEATNLTSLKEGGIILLDRSKGTIVPIDVTKPNLTPSYVGESAVVANDGSRVWVQVHYVGPMGATQQYDLLEVDRAAKKLWTRISLEGYDSMSGTMEMEGSANADWIAIQTDEPITDSTGFVDSNAQYDLYLLRAH